MNRQVLVLLFFVLALAYGCEKKIELDLPEEQRLVLLSNFSPDSLFRVSLATTLPINDDTIVQFPDYPANANIQLFENGSYVDDLTYEPGVGYMLPSYVLNFKPKEKANYSITATVPGYPSVASSNRIPSAVGIEGLEEVFIDEVEYIPDVFDYFVSANLKIEDQTDTLEYFHLLAWQKVDGRLESVFIYPFENLGQEILHEDGFLFNSNDLSSSSKSIEVGFNFTYYSNTERSPILIELRNVSEDYYRFHESVGEQEFSALNTQTVLSTEAYFIFNNIEGGIGNFSSYSSATYPLEY